MKIAALMVMTMMAGVMARAGQPQKKLTVYLVDKGPIPPAIRTAALDLAAKMLTTIGIRLDWRRSEPPRISSERLIVIELATRTPSNLLPGALGYALPYEGVHITVFYDRIPREVVPLTIAVLSHVLVHEIAHVLQRVSRHSDSGIMKAVWTNQDYRRMKMEPLLFTPRDVELIQLGMENK